MVDTLIVTDARGVVRRVNEVTCRLSGYVERELVGRPVGILFVEQKKMPFMEYWMKKLDTGMVARDVGMTLRTKSGVDIPMFFSGSVMKNRRGDVLGSVFVGRDMRETQKLMQSSTEAILDARQKATELRKHAQELADQKAYNEEIVSAIPTALLVLNTEFDILSVNRRYQELFGLGAEEVYLRPFVECVGEISDETRARILERLEQLKSQGGAMASFEFPFLRADRASGAEPAAKIVSMSAVVLRLTRDVRLLILLEDVTESKRLMEHLVRSEKLEATTNLAAGLAHEIKNPLGIILGHIQLLSMKLKAQQAADGDVKHSVQVIEKMVDRATSLVRGLMDFARETEVRPKPIQLHEFLSGILDMVFPRMNEHKIHLIQQYPRRRPMTIRADETMMTQLFTNLLFNAIESMTDGGELRVETLAVEETNMAQVRIADSGCGIPPEHLARVFQPFFSTKPKGTGMGLPVCYGIVEKHGGQIDIQSEAGRGTTVTVWLPLHAPKHAGTP